MSKFALDLDDESELSPENDMFSESFTANIPGLDLQMCSKNIRTDDEGYYVFQCNQLIANRYLTIEFLGKGVFGCVIKAKKINQISSQSDETTDQLVAIKIFRRNPYIAENGRKETQLMRKIKTSSQDLKDSNVEEGFQHIVTMVDDFEWCNHFCIVYEVLAGNLREILEKHGKYTGIALQSIQIIGKQLLEAIKSMHSIGIIHADIKPDNILINSSKNIIKLADFGCSIDCGIINRPNSSPVANVPMPYLASRFYRAPELILGCPDFGGAIDIWAVAITLIELFCGKVPFEACTNGQMLQLMTQKLGKIPKSLKSRATMAEKYFHPFTGNLMCTNASVSMTTAKCPENEIYELLKCNVATSAEDLSLVKKFSTALASMLNLNDRKRLTAEECLKLPFFDSLK